MLRYPGGKDRIKKDIVGPIEKYFNKIEDVEYIEPFFGGGSIGLELFKKTNIKKIWINDKDYALSCFWSSVINSPEKICEKIRQYTPKVSDFFCFKDNLTRENLSNLDPIEVGFQKLVIHKTSFSGLGVKSGPVGGKNQDGNWKIDARWNPNKLIKDINNVNKVFSGKQIRENKCTWLDYSSLIEKSEDKRFIYLDPPYYVQGEGLYLHYFETHHHVEMRDVLLETEYPWLLSYDDCKEIRDLYSFAHIKEIEVSYGIVNGRKKIELLICPKKINWIFEEEKITKKEIF